MKKGITLLILSFLLILSSHLSYGQNVYYTSDKDKFEEVLNRFSEKWEGKAFPIDLNNLIDINNEKHIYIDKNKIILLGFSTCPPCKLLFPAFIEAAQKKAANRIYIYKL